MKLQNLILLGLGAFFLLRKTGGLNGINSTNQITAEAKILNPWIKSWQKANQYKNWSLKERNNKYLQDFKEFMQSQGFSSNSIKFWLNT